MLPSSHVPTRMELMEPLIWSVDPVTAPSTLKAAILEPVTPRLRAAFLMLMVPRTPPERKVEP